MRAELKPYLGKFVHCSGWIIDWSTFEDMSTRQICVSSVTVKKPDRMQTFDHQQTICQLDHLNIFCNKELHPSNSFEMYKRIFFSGVVVQYSRKDGTIDYGVQQTVQIKVANILEYVNKEIDALIRGRIDFASWQRLQETMTFLAKIENAVEQLGDYLPTFHYDYVSLKKGISQSLRALSSYAIQMRVMCSNRRLRRQHKISSSLAEKILASTSCECVHS